MSNSPRSQLPQYAILITLLIQFTFVAYAAVIPLSNLPTPPRLRGRFSPKRSTKGQNLWHMKTHSYNQTLDHFNYRPESYKTFSQRYMINEEHWGGAKANAPIFVYLGAESPLDEEVDDGVGFQFDIAPHFGALLVAIEHRYYGMSIPDGSTSILDDPENRGYFSSAQALADYAEIILFLKIKYKARYSPVIVFGGSYGGMLAAWLRLKYPHVTIGALASSAPIFLTISPPDTYDKWVNKVYRETSINCYNTIKNSWIELVNLGNEPNGLALLQQKFNTCSPIEYSAYLGYMLVDLYLEQAQYDEPPLYPLSQLCNTIDGAAAGTSNLDKVAGAVIGLSGGRCFGTPLASHFMMSSEAPSGWYWQSCTEFLGSTYTFDPNTTDDSMLPYTFNDREGYIEGCVYQFGIDPRPNWVETYYGAYDLKLVLKRFGSNIIFSNGLKDPYSQEGVLEDISDTLVAIKTANGSHCLDLVAAMNTDPKWLTEMRDKEVAIMKGWLSVYYEDLHNISITTKVLSTEQAPYI